MDSSDMPEVNGEMATAHKLSREIPELARPKSSPGEPTHAAELATSLGDFAFWLHDQWPALIDEVEEMRAMVMRVDARTSDILDNVSAIKAYLKKLVEGLGLDKTPAKE